MSPRRRGPIATLHGPPPSRGSTEGRSEMVRPGFVYIMASRKNGTIYIGVTSDLPQRIWQHREGMIEGFTKEYGCKLLVWFEAFESIHDARQFEARMKKWNRRGRSAASRSATPSGPICLKRLFETPQEMGPCLRRGTASLRL
ncbi:protein of unknown function [uncultured Sphingopyxis sp.]|uniref:GIY-YIG domain-containing protein n=1 Tax=uncultured Sphingopyxis sp. TaxID=310581 RepID=A0A1Y5PZ64_9SPHN|nr:protein of unknown function [uncultured Sphingopyxis sp.]